MQSNVIKAQRQLQVPPLQFWRIRRIFLIKANIEETDIFKIKVGQKVEIKIDAYPGKKFTGYVESIGAATQNALSQSASLNTSVHSAR